MDKTGLFIVLPRAVLVVASAVQCFLDFLHLHIELLAGCTRSTEKSIDCLVI